MEKILNSHRAGFNICPATGKRYNLSDKNYSLDSELLKAVESGDQLAIKAARNNIRDAEYYKNTFNNLINKMKKEKMNYSQVCNYIVKNCYSLATLAL